MHPAQALDHSKAVILRTQPAQGGESQNTACTRPRASEHHLHVAAPLSREQGQFTLADKIASNDSVGFPVRKAELILLLLMEGSGPKAGKEDALGFRDCRAAR